MESNRRLKPEDEPRPPEPGLGQGLASLLPPDADDEDAGPTVQSGLSAGSDLPGRPNETGHSHSTAMRAGPALATRPAAQTRDLNEVVHRILIVGLVLSTALLLIGLLLALLTGQPLPTATLPPAEALQRALELDPSGFFSLGLLVLMFTPVVRVIGSIGVFAWERDWLYFGVTLVVFTIMLVSVILGRV